MMGVMMMVVVMVRRLVMMMMLNDMNLNCSKFLMLRED